MQINCAECNGKAIIQSRKQLDIKMSQLYCSCKNPHCGHTFVMDLTFSHTLSPSAQQAENNIISLLRAMPQHQLEMIKAAL